MPNGVRKAKPKRRRGLLWRATRTGLVVYWLVFLYPIFYIGGFRSASRAKLYWDQSMPYVLGWATLGLVNDMVFPRNGLLRNLGSFTSAVALFSAWKRATEHFIMDSEKKTTKPSKPISKDLPVDVDLVVVLVSASLYVGLLTYAFAMRSLDSSGQDNAVLPAGREHNVSTDQQQLDKKLKRIYAKLDRAAAQMEKDIAECDRLVRLGANVYGDVAGTHSK